MATKKESKGSTANVKSYVANNPIAALAEQLNSTIGPGTIMVGGQQVPNVDFISTGIATLDAIMGGGIPRGRIIEIFGAEGSGKTTTTLEIVAACQRIYFDKYKRNGVCAFVDAEHALDPVWARNIGIDMDNMLLNQPADGEEAFKVVEMIARSNSVDLIVVDSVAALIPQAVLNGSIEDNHIGAQARLMSQGLNRLKGIINNSKTSVIFINQIRHKIGVQFGSPETTPGGLALKYYASMRVDLRRGETIKGNEKNGDKPIGVVCKAKIIKNKVAPPFCNCVYTIYFGAAPVGGQPIYGVDKIGCLFDAGLHHNVISRASSFYYFNGIKLGNGRDKAIATIMADNNLAVNLRTALMAAVTPTGIDQSRLTDDEFNDSLSDESGAIAADEEDLTSGVEV